MLKSVEVLITLTSLEERSISRISGNRVGEAATVKRELPEIDKSPIAVYGKSRFLSSPVSGFRMAKRSVLPML